MNLDIGNTKCPGEEICILVLWVSKRSIMVFLLLKVYTDLKFRECVYLLKIWLHYFFCAGKTNPEYLTILTVIHGYYKKGFEVCIYTEAAIDILLSAAFKYADSSPTCYLCWKHVIHLPGSKGAIWSACTLGLFSKYPRNDSRSVSAFWPLQLNAVC